MKSIQLEIINSDSIIEKEVVSITVHIKGEGYVEILPDHLPIVAEIDEYTAIDTNKERTSTKFFNAILHFKDNNAAILVNR